MIEEKVRSYLEEQLNIPVRMEEEAGLPEEYVLLERTGGSQVNYIDKAIIAIQSYSKNTELNIIMKNIIEMDEISECELNSDYNYTDTSRKKYRYQAVYELTYY